MKLFGYIIVISLFVASCKPGIPSDVLSEGTMVDVLYDMHVAQAMSQNHNITKDDKEVIALRASILEKHGITKAQWDRSYLFYCGHTDYLYEVYQSLNERMNDEVVALGGKADGMEEGEAADSTNIWNAESHFLLMQNMPYDRMSFSVKPDSTFHDGDRINLQYDVQLLFQEGMKDITVSMNVLFDNDSIATRTNHVSVDGSGVISVSNDVDRLKVKKITGFFYMSRSLDDSAIGVERHSAIPVFKLAAFRNVKLLHLHTDPPAPISTEHSDSLNNKPSEVDIQPTGMDNQPEATPQPTNIETQSHDRSIDSRLSPKSGSKGGHRLLSRPDNIKHP